MHIGVVSLRSAKAKKKLQTYTHYMEKSTGPHLLTIKVKFSVQLPQVYKIKHLVMQSILTKNSKRSSFF